VSTQMSVSAYLDLSVLVVDLNNFARYPTIAIGYMKSILTQQGCEVTVLSPLAHGIPGISREPHETPALNIARKVNYALHQIPGRLADSVRRNTGRMRAHRATRHFPTLGDIFKGTDPGNYDAVLVSAYLMYHPVCIEIGEQCKAAGVPLIIGGSYFAEEEVAKSWIDIPGLHALIGGEVELELADILRAAVDGGDLASFDGVWLPDGSGRQRAPLKELDEVPFPDYSDFPWDRYPNKIIPVITGRGCGWGACTFCSDITSTAGRTYRSRSPSNVLAELGAQSERHGTSLFAFTDLKLNSDLSVWNAILQDLPKHVIDPQWIASVHVGKDQPNGLDLERLKKAKAAGAVRLTTGLESGSQRVLDAFAKGADLEVTSRFLHDAKEAGISIRITMIHGSPGETEEDVNASAEFLRSHGHLIDRVLMNRFQLMLGPTIMRRWDENADRFPSVIVTDRNPLMATADHRNTNAHRVSYFRATQRMLQQVHEINKKPLPDAALAFEGVM